MDALVRHLCLRHVVAVCGGDGGRPMGTTTAAAAAGHEGVNHGPEAVLAGRVVHHHHVAAAPREERRHGHLGELKRGSEEPGVSAWGRRRWQGGGVTGLPPGCFQVQAAEAFLEYRAVFVMVRTWLGQRGVPCLVARTTTTKYVSTKKKPVRWLEVSAVSPPPPLKTYFDEPRVCVKGEEALLARDHNVLKVVEDRSDGRHSSFRPGKTLARPRARRYPRYIS